MIYPMVELSEDEWIYVLAILDANREDSDKKVALKIQEIYDKIKQQIKEELVC